MMYDFTDEDEMALPKYKGFAWVPGMSVRHVSRKMRICYIEEDEWLGQAMFILHCFYDPAQPLADLIAKDETFVDLEDPVTAQYCRAELDAGRWCRP